MALRSAKYLPALKRAMSGAKSTRATPGERLMGRLFPNSTYAANWSGNRFEQVQHMTDWTFVAINAIWMKAASMMPNMARVHDKPLMQGSVKKTIRADQRSMMNVMGRGFGATPFVGGQTLGEGKNKSYVGEYVGCSDWNPDAMCSNNGSSFMTIGEYRSKALSVVKPHEELEPLDNEHLLRRQFENPNPVDTSFDYTYELGMFLELCGVAYEWVIPNAMGKPCERWVIPSHWVWPKSGGGTDPTEARPDADHLIEYYEVRPWGGTGSAGMLRLPPDQVICHRFKSPISKLDGYSKLWAISRWIDIEESISKSRWAQFINQARPEFWIELGPQYEDPDDAMMDRLYAKVAQRHQGELAMHRPIITPAGSKVTALSFSPTEMAYFQSEEQIRDMILSTFMVPKSAVGVVSDMTFGSILATLMAFCEGCINPRLAMMGQTLTKHLASRWDEDGVRVKLWWDNVTPADPAQVNSDLSTDFQCHAVTPNEVRVLRGRKPYRIGGDNPLVQGPGGIMPLPINEEERMDDLGELVAMYTSQVAGKKDADKLATQQSDDDIPKEEVDGGDGGVGGSAGAVPSVDDAAEEAGLEDGGAVDEPNGKPSKSLVRKSTSTQACISAINAWYANPTLAGIREIVGMVRGMGDEEACAVGNKYARYGDWPHLYTSESAAEMANEVQMILTNKLRQRGRKSLRRKASTTDPVVLQGTDGRYVLDLSPQLLVTWTRDETRARKWRLASATTAQKALADVGIDVRPVAVGEAKATKQFRKWCRQWTKQYEGHSYSSTQFNLEGPALEHVLALQSQIDDTDLADKGKEDIPHVTIKYGLETSDAGEVRDVVETFGPVNVELGELDYFPSEEYDVLILRVTGDDIHALNETIAELPSVDTHLTYQPHVTIAYLKPGKGAEYMDVPQRWEDEQPLQFTELVFSPKEGTPSVIDLASYEWQEATGSSSYDDPRAASTYKDYEPGARVEMNGRRGRVRELIAEPHGAMAAQVRWDDGGEDTINVRRLREVQGQRTQLHKMMLREKGQLDDAVEGLLWIGGNTKWTMEELNPTVRALVNHLYKRGFVKRDADGSFRISQSGSALRGILRQALSDMGMTNKQMHKGLSFGTISDAGKWLARKWEQLEERYTRTGALAMATAMIATSPLPGNIAAVIAVAEGLRAVSGRKSITNKRLNAGFKSLLPIKERHATNGHAPAVAAAVKSEQQLYDEARERIEKAIGGAT